MRLVSVVSVLALRETLSGFLTHDFRDATISLEFSFMRRCVKQGKKRFISWNMKKTFMNSTCTLDVEQNRFESVFFVV